MRQRLLARSKEPVSSMPVVVRFSVAALLVACSAPPATSGSSAKPQEVADASANVSVSAPEPDAVASAPPPAPPSPASVATSVAGRSPRVWGQKIDGVVSKLAPSKQTTLAITLDACGGPGGNDYDAELIDFLKAEQIPATLFLTARWIEARRDTARELAREKLFSIENHGGAHKPCSVNGRAAYGIPGTSSVEAAIEEILRGSRAIEALTGRAPQFYRSGTAFFDDVCVDLALGLGETPTGYTVSDGGTGFTRAQVRDALLKATDGSIVLFHMNHPRGATAEGLMDAIPVLVERGVRFVRLDASLL